MRSFLFCLSLLSAVLFLHSCGSPNTPLDADTRQRIDSIAIAETRLARAEIDSLCQQQRAAVLPKLIDSIRQVRLREIEAQLQSIPKQ